MGKPLCSVERREVVREFASLRMLPADLGRFVTSFLDETSPVQLQVKQLLDSRDYMSLAQLSVDPRVYDDPEIYFWDRQATEVLRKYPFPGMEHAAEQKAKETFFAAEAACEVTNQRFSASGEHLFTGPQRTLIKQVRRHIREVLGEFSFQEMVEEARHGPGSCQLLDDFDLSSRGNVGSEFKFESKISLTHDLVSLAGGILKQYPLWDSASIAAHGGYRFRPVEGNKITFVPKSALTHRTIAIEPMLNVFLQLGIGGMIRRRLGAKAGFDLDHSWKKNQDLARAGSIDGSFATIDLSSASDMISYSVVGTLLPRSWFQALDLVRSPTGTLPGDSRAKRPSIRVCYQKFSSMGNGATFELESLIFWAICRACGVAPDKLAVFGDDIVVPCHLAEQVIEALQFFGFQTNLQKTFVTGPFRESCGKDFFLGRDVRPLYVTNAVDNGQKVVNLANAVRDLAVRRNERAGCKAGSADIRLQKSWYLLLDYIPTRIRTLIESPPYTAFGLWKGNLSHCRSPSGQYLPRWSIKPVAKAAELSFVGAGLLAARLSGASLTTWKFRPWEGLFSFRVEEVRGGGNSSYQARQIRWVVGLSVDTGTLNGWGGWV